MPLFSVMKRNAKLALRGHWGVAVGLVLVVLTASMVLGMLQTFALQLFAPPVELDAVFSAQYGIDSETFQRFARASLIELGISGGFMLLTVLLLAPLNLGIIHWNLELIQGGSPTFGEAFRYFESGKRYGRALMYELQLTVRALLWAILFFCLPSVLLGISMAITAQGETANWTMLTIASLGIVFSSVLFLLATLLYLALMMKYTLAPYLLCGDETLSVRKAIRLSASYTKGFRFRLMLFHLSFLGWILLCIFVVPVLIVAPYMQAAGTVYARYMIERQRITPPEPTREFGPAVQEQTVPPQEKDLPLEEQPQIKDSFAFPPSKYPAPPLNGENTETAAENPPKETEE